MKSCAVDGCEKVVKVTGLCWMHYMRKRRNGDFEVRKADDGAPMALVLASVNYNGDDCLIWPYAKNNGYGVLEVEKGRNMHAHRYICILRHGPPPFEEAHAAHNCGKGKDGCFAPNHVRWATKAENEADKFIHGTTPRGERHGLSKLTTEQVLAIVADARSQYEIANDYGCTQTTVSNIKRGVSWGWLTGIRKAA